MSYIARRLGVPPTGPGGRGGGTISYGAAETATGTIQTDHAEKFSESINFSSDKFEKSLP